MKKFYTTTYYLYNPKVNNNLVFSVDSDLHFSHAVKNKKLLAIADNIAKTSPNYILIPGDLIDSVETIRNSDEQKRLLSWLGDIATIAPVLISLGSHDYYAADGKNWKYEFNQELIDAINSISDVSILNNESYDDENVFVTGITQSFEYYHGNRDAEDKTALVEELQQNTPANIPNNKLNILLIHSPIYMFDSDILKMVNDYDLIVCGHMHNGCVPPVMTELWQSTRGLIAPNKKLFPLNARNTLIKKEDKVLVNGPLTMFQECTGILQMANLIFPMYNSTINFTNNPEYDQDKILVRRKYN